MYQELAGRWSRSEKLKRRETFREPPRCRGRVLVDHQRLPSTVNTSLSPLRMITGILSDGYIQDVRICVACMCVCVITEIEWHESGRKGQKRNLDKDLVKCRGMGNCDGYPACTSLSFSLSLATFRSSSSFGGLTLDPFSPSGSLRSHDHKPSTSLQEGNA
jgi:hypothetical protein